MKEKDSDQVNIPHAYDDNDADVLKEAADTVIKSMYMGEIKKFLEEGQKHGTVVEALYEAFRVIKAGEAQDILGALYIATKEWYK
jgi:hypothetical protein